MKPTLFLVLVTLGCARHGYASDHEAAEDAELSVSGHGGVCDTCAPIDTCHTAKCTRFGVCIQVGDTGCWNDTGTCWLWSDEAHCGEGGVPCEVCAPEQECIGGSCFP
jgi:hypothetical protein